LPAIPAARQEPRPPIDTQGAPAADTCQPSYYWTWRLLSSGFPPDQCAAIRGIPQKVVYEHALQALQSSLQIRTEWILSKELIQLFQSMPQDLLAGDINAILRQLPANTLPEEVAIYRKLINPGK
jgi:ATP-dependent DNA helicase RecQ